MQSLSLCCYTSRQPLSIFKNHLQCPKIRSCQSYAPHLKQNQHPFASKFLGFKFNPLRVSSNCIEGVMMKKKKIHGFGTVCYAAPLSPQNLQLISTISTVILMLVRGTSIHKAFLAPLFALQAPESIVSWMKGEYGIWSAFLALLVRLFFSIPGELEVPFITLLLVIVAPYQVTKLRGTQEGIILSLVIAAYLAFQHYSRAGSLSKVFEQGSVVASLAIICIIAAPCLLLV